VTPVVEVSGLSRRFGSVTAVDDVDVTVERGQIYGFLGRNGAGKTTLIRCLLGLIPPSSGHASLFGTTVRAGRTPCRIWAEVGYLVEGPGLTPWLTVFEHLDIAAGFRNLPRDAVDRVITRLELGRCRDVRAGMLSLGNRQRLGLALALIHEPDLLILDEPVNGLDPAGVVEVRGLLRDLADRGVTVFMSSHNLGEVARLADRVGIIHAGRMLTELSADRLATNGARLVSAFRTAALAQQAAGALRARGLDAVHDQRRVSTSSSVAIERPDDVATWLVDAGAAPMSLGLEHEDLEEVFLRLTEGAPECTP
jgi:ABC-2 type transport system ATP-binding protein